MQKGSESPQVPDVMYQATIPPLSSTPTASLPSTTTRPPTTTTRSETTIRSPSTSTRLQLPSTRPPSTSTRPPTTTTISLSPTNRLPTSEDFTLHPPPGG